MVRQPYCADDLEIVVNRVSDELRVEKFFFVFFFFSVNPNLLFLQTPSFFLFCPFFFFLFFLSPIFSRAHPKARGPSRGEARGRGPTGPNGDPA